jgi:hypothetical protein
LILQKHKKSNYLKNGGLRVWVVFAAEKMAGMIFIMNKAKMRSDGSESI